MQKELKIKLLPNNQVSLFTQWVNRKSEERFLVRPDYSKEPEYIKEYYRSGQAKFDRERKKTHETVRVPYYKADGTIKFRLLRVPILEKCGKDKKMGLAGLSHALDITKKSQRRMGNQTGWGVQPSPRKFSNRAGQKIRECGAMLDKASGYEPSYCRVITLTLAGDTPEAFRAISDYSGYAINRIFQPIRLLDSEKTKWFFVWEHQKRGALHLHIALYHPIKETAKCTGQAIIEKWIQVLKDIQEKSGVDMFVRRDYKSYTSEANYQNMNQEMRKSCGGYFSKYAGKSSQTKENSYVHKWAKIYPPSRFWGSSRNLKQMCRENSFEEILAIGEAIEDKHQDILSLILLHNPVKFHSFEWKKKLNEGTEREVVISEGKCEVFYLSKERYSELLTMLSNAS
jgi:hypothetical protein